MSSALPKQHYTLEEYLKLEKNAEQRYEYFDGEVVAMGGASLNHNRITRNIIRSLENALAEQGCEVLPADMRVKVPKAFPYRYPDAVVVCGEPIIEEMHGQEMLVNPILIVEVLSPTTEAYDRGAKFSAYQSITSFQEYLLIAQDRPHITQYVRQPHGKWLRSEVEGMDGELRLESLHCRLALSDVYRRVEFHKPGEGRE
jgi:Uma2 family endonuclease